MSEGIREIFQKLVFASSMPSQFRGKPHKERWFGVEYEISGNQSITTLPNEDFPYLSIPRRNKFIPDANMTIKSSIQKNPIFVPKKIHEADGLVLWHRLDDAFGLPHVKVLICIQLPVFNCRPETETAKSLAISLLYQSMIDELYEASLGVLDCW